MLGYPPTTLDLTAPSSQTIPSDEDFGMMLEKVHGGVRQTEVDSIMREQPDIREYGLMDGTSSTY